MPEALNKISHRRLSAQPQQNLDGHSAVASVCYRNNGLDIEIVELKEKMASIYKDKFRSEKEIDIKKITAELIEKFRLRNTILLEKMDHQNKEAHIMQNIRDVEEFEKGELDLRIFIGIIEGKNIGIRVRNNLFKTLGIKFWGNKSEKEKNDDSESAPEKTLENLALIYQKKFLGSKEINPKKITTGLIYQIGNKITTLPFKMNPDSAYYQELEKKNAKELETFENGAMDDHEFIRIAKIIDPRIQYGFLKTLQTEAWRKIKEIVRV